LYAGGRFARSAVAFVKREEILFKSLPSTDAIQEVITKYLPTISSRTTNDGEPPTKFDKLSLEELSSFQQAIERFLKKGKHVSFADLQDILQGVFASSEETVPALVVEDFEVRTSLDAPPSARVTVRIGNHVFEASDTGVGPVDAVINALRKACGNTVSFSLDNFNVAIRSQGTDAVVVVEMKLSREGNFSLAVGTSPDVIQASIEAFQAAYNGLPQ